MTLPEDLGDDSSQSLGFAFRMQREKDENTASTAAIKGFTPLSQFLPDSYFADDGTDNKQGFTVWGSHSDKSTLLPGKDTVLFRKGLARHMSDGKFDALALVLTANRLTIRQIKDKNIRPQDEKKTVSPETTDKKS